MHATVAATPNATRTPRWVREYVREHMLPNIVQRLYEIGMGTTRFEQATMVGKVVKVPASPAVQVRALDSLKLLGVPQQLGLADEEGNTVPGVLVMPPLELEATRDIAHGAMRGGTSGLEYVEEDEAHEEGINADTAPAPIENTVHPTLVRRVRARHATAQQAKQKKGRRNDA